ncbi:ABC transporter permease [bacterium]|nr:ABC transporter permease [bacterium]
MPRPPHILETWLRRLLPDRDKESLPGDFAEMFHQIATTRNRFKALLWYLSHIFKLIPNHFIQQINSQWALFSHVVMASIRIISRQRLYMGITIIGMVLGLAIGLTTIGYMSYEASFEDHHEHKDRVYRINGRQYSPDGEDYSSQVMAPLGPEMKANIPGVEAAAIFRILGEVDLRLGEKGFIPDEQRHSQGYVHNSNCFCANTDFLNVFTLPLLVGDKQTVLEKPFSVLITESAAKEHFGDKDPMGQTVKLGPDLLCQITGILKDIPYNTQVHCNFIISWPTMSRLDPVVPTWDRLGNVHVYVKLKETALPANVAESISGIMENHLSAAKAAQYQFELQPLKSLYFDTFGSGRRGDLRPHGEKSMLWTLGIIGAAILLLAMLNFINLSTARATDRLKEVGLRKVIGASKSQLLRQFLGETLFIMILALLFSIIIYEGFKFWVTPQLERPMFADFYNNPRFVTGILTMVLSVTLAAGFYPAWIMAHRQPAVILQNRQSARSSKSMLRKSLVIFQFVIAIAFVGTTAIQYNQFKYLTSVALGFNSENILLLDLGEEHSADDVQRMKSHLQTGDQAVSVTKVSTPPGRDGIPYCILYKNAACTEEESIVSRVYDTDDDFFETFDIQLVKGRFFSEQRQTDFGNAILINESGVRALGTDDPIGMQLHSESGKSYHIVGVVKDFQGTTQYSFSSNISIIALRPERARTLAIQLPTGSTGEAIKAIKKTWDEQLPDEVFEYTFLEDEIKAMYDGLNEPTRIMVILSIMTMFMAGSGILGLVAFTARQKTKEIGIRKVMGASIGQIVYLLGREFIPLVLISMAIAIPLSYLGAQDMLNDYAVQAPINPLLFLTVGLTAMLIAVLAAAIQGVRAARANPIKAIQCE